MKKLFLLTAACGVLGLSACAGTDHSASYTYETEAPFSESRTVGTVPTYESKAKPKATKVKKADRYFESSQRK